MAIVKRNAVQLPSLPKETVAVPEIGGDVVVRAILLADRLNLVALQSSLSQPLPGESEDDASARAGASLIGPSLAVSVLADDGKPLWSAEQWNEFGAANSGVALRLFAVAMRLSGGSLEAARKN